MVKNNFKYIFLLFVITIFVALVLTVPVFTKVSPHADESQFYFNAFRIMEGKELNNYFHVAVTEYFLAAFFSIVNIITGPGVNFPQGDPSLATYYWARYFGFIFYFVTFLLGIVILQKKDKAIKLRSVIFSILYFGSIGIFERFFRVNSDSTLVFVYLNYVILSLWMHKNKASNMKFLLLNLAFIFFGSFTNLKFLYLSVPLVLINIILPFFVYQYKTSEDQQLPKIYKFILYSMVLVLGVVVLWAIFIPKPFNALVYWYSIKRLTLYGTKFDFEFPGQAYGSWKVYIFDLFAEYIGFNVVLAGLLFILVAYKYTNKKLFEGFSNKFKSMFDLSLIKEGDLYHLTELILFLSFMAYYVGISMNVIHWSRWGVPLGILGIMLISVFFEKIIENLIKYRNDRFKNTAALFLITVLLAYSLRVLLTIDLYRSDFPARSSFKSTYASVDKFLVDHRIKPEDGPKKAAWFTGYTNNIGNISIESIGDPKYSELEYVFWPYWNLTVLYANGIVDKGTHNQRAIINKYGKNISYGFPTFTSYYTHFIALLSNRYLGLTYIPEIEGMVESQYGILELKESPKEISLSYDVSFKDMSHYYFPYSLVFNMSTLKDSYLFPPCYTYPDTFLAKTGDPALPPAEFGVGGRTAGLYCHSVRFRIFPKGVYRIRIEGLPEDVNGVQKVFSNSTGFEWDPATKTFTFDSSTTTFVGDFGIATEEKNIPNLKFRIFYRYE